MLVAKYLDGITHINVTPKAAQKVSNEAVDAHVLGVTMAQQFSLHAGLKKFRYKANVLVTKELTQLHNMGTYVLMHPDEMIKDQNNQALRFLIFVNEKN